MKTAILGLCAALFAAVPAFAHQVDHGAMIAHLVFPVNGVHAHVSWETAPTLEAAAVMKVEFRRPSDHSLTDITSDLSVGVTMPDMEHGDIPTTPPEQKTDENGNLIVGTYSVGNVSLYMGGRWQITLTLTSATGEQESQSFDFEMADDGGGHHH